MLCFKQKGRVVDFNAGVGRSEETSNASGTTLISLLDEVELVICNGRRLVSEPEWTRVRLSLGQRSVIDYVSQIFIL